MYGAATYLLFLVLFSRARCLILTAVVLWEFAMSRKVFGVADLSSHAVKAPAAKLSGQFECSALVWLLIVARSAI